MPEKKDSYKEVYLLRHGETTMAGRYVGALDVPLSKKGDKQTASLAPLVKSIAVEYVFCSPLLRCRQTLTNLDLTVQFEFNNDLKEINFGRWEGKSFAEILAMDGDLVTQWSLNPDKFGFPDGESIENFQRRVVRAKKTVTDNEYRKILIVTHGGVIRYLLCYFLGLSVKNYLAFDVQLGKMSVLRIYPTGGVITAFNVD